jgi:hypothetical protein
MLARREVYIYVCPNILALYLPGAIVVAGSLLVTIA